MSWTNARWIKNTDIIHYFSIVTIPCDMPVSAKAIVSRKSRSCITASPKDSLGPTEVARGTDNARQAHDAHKVQTPLVLIISI